MQIHAGRTQIGCCQHLGGGVNGELLLNGQGFSFGGAESILEAGVVVVQHRECTECH